MELNGEYKKCGRLKVKLEYINWVFLFENLFANISSKNKYLEFYVNLLQQVALELEYDPKLVYHCGLVAKKLPVCIAALFPIVKPFLFNSFHIPIVKKFFFYSFHIYIVQFLFYSRILLSTIHWLQLKSLKNLWILKK